MNGKSEYISSGIESKEKQTKQFWSGESPALFEFNTQMENSFRRDVQLLAMPLMADLSSPTPEKTKELSLIIHQELERNQDADFTPLELDERIIESSLKNAELSILMEKVFTGFFKGTALPVQVFETEIKKITANKERILILTQKYEELLKRIEADQEIVQENESFAGILKRRAENNPNEEKSTKQTLFSIETVGRMKQEGRIRSEFSFPEIVKVIKGPLTDLFIIHEELEEIFPLEVQDKKELQGFPMPSSRLKVINGDRKVSKFSSPEEIPEDVKKIQVNFVFPALSKSEEIQQLVETRAFVFNKPDTNGRFKVIVRVPDEVFINRESFLKLPVENRHQSKRFILFEEDIMTIRHELRHVISHLLGIRKERKDKEKLDFKTELEFSESSLLDEAIANLIMGKLENFAEAYFLEPHYLLNVLSKKRGEEEAFGLFENRWDGFFGAVKLLTSHEDYDKYAFRFLCYHFVSTARNIEEYTERLKCALVYYKTQKNI